MLCDPLGSRVSARERAGDTRAEIITGTEKNKEIHTSKNTKYVCIYLIVVFLLFAPYKHPVFFFLLIQSDKELYFLDGVAPRRRMFCCFRSVLLFVFHSRRASFSYKQSI